ncbi:hypothetical protein NL676_034710 [Syzygium grande]|nr:hypothetical protein NL676_034710 [Syzygium grande]
MNKITERVYMGRRPPQATAVGLVAFVSLISGGDRIDKFEDWIAGDHRHDGYLLMARIIAGCGDQQRRPSQ